MYRLFCQINRFNRPAALTAILILCSFGCGVGGAVVIGVISERTKKKLEVSRRIWGLLKADEEAIELKKKEHLVKSKDDAAGGKKHSQGDDGAV